MVQECRGAALLSRRQEARPACMLPCRTLTTLPLITLILPCSPSTHKPLLVATCHPSRSQVLQTLSILIQNLRTQQTLYYLFSNNHINEIVSMRFDFEDDEVLVRAKGEGGRRGLARGGWVGGWVATSTRSSPCALALRTTR